MTEQVETLVVAVTPAETIRKFAGLVTKLDKADSRAAESDKEAAKLNEELMGMCQGTVPQNVERSMANVVSEKTRAEKKAANIRGKTGEEAVTVRNEFLALQAQVTRLLAGYGLSLDPAVDPEQAPVDEDFVDDEQDVE